ncbi:unnamed protein product [Prunus armeniaca]
MALSLMSAEVPKCSIEEYMMFFRHCIKRSAAQWQVAERSITPTSVPGSLAVPQVIPLKSYRICNRGTLWRDVDDLELHKDCMCVVNKINNSADALYPSWEPNSCISVEYDAWWKARFTGLLDSSSATKTIKDINAQVIEGKLSILPIYFCHCYWRLGAPFWGRRRSARNSGRTADCRGNSFARRNKREETTQAQDSAVQPEILAESPPTPLTRSKRLRKKAVAEYEEIEEPTAILTETSGTVLQEKEVDVSTGDEKKGKEVEEEEEIPVEVIAESLLLANNRKLKG